MDGNGRWARQRNLPRSEGHRAGSEATRTVVTECRRLGIPYLTLYAFSTENWGRPREEVSFLFDLLVRFLRQELKTLLEQSIRLNVIGDQQALSRPVRMALDHVRSKTANCSEMVLTLALNYSAREEILRACRTIASQVEDGAQIDEQLFRENLYTRDMPDPDLILRTSGEHRLSNYLLFQGAYSELYFTPVLWPDFGVHDLHQALEDYAGRQRRFGLTEEQ